MRCIRQLCSIELGFNVDLKKFTTYACLRKDITKEIGDTRFQECASSVLESMKKQNVTFISMGAEENERGFLKSLRERAERKFQERGRRKDGKLPNFLVNEFLDDLYSKEYEKTDLYKKLMKDGSIEISLKMNGTRYQAKDTVSSYINIQNGERLTKGQPEDYDGCIYMYGPCTIMGAFCEDQYTIASHLQKLLNDAGIKRKVINKGIWGPKQKSVLHSIAAEDFRSGDIVIWDSFDIMQKFDLHINYTDVLESSDISVEWIVEDPRHCNHRVNAVYAKAIFQKVLPLTKNVPSYRKAVKCHNNYFAIDYINTWFRDFDSKRYSSVGSIVMNCNPFTKGHRYLIESALESVEYLIIFVVEEDKSVFDFEERYAMVQDGTIDLDNVMVVPSGDYILSQTTFPEYFVKIEDEDIKANVENDISIFASRIAPLLNITHRFVGEEKDDSITDAYNTAMKEILPKYGIQLVEIPRKELDGDRIRATNVRLYLENKNTEKLKRLVPETTMKILFPSS